MKRGEVWWVRFQHSTGGEIHKTRPAVIVSNDVANRHLNRVQIIPFTSSIGKVYPGEALVTVAGRTSKALADQISTVSKQRLERKLGDLSREDLASVGEIIRVQLDKTDWATSALFSRG